MDPKITVLMPVYNGEQYLREAIDSILLQTFRDFEFLIIDDGCHDKSVQIINTYTDPRIRLVHNDHNQGITATLNRGLDLARGEYIARMDCDDVSFLERLEKQFAFMESHPDIGLCGTWVTAGKVVGQYPKTHQECVTYKFFNSPFAHPTVMLRRAVVEKYNLRYAYEGAVLCEDLELWRRCIKVTTVGNICEPLLYYRIHGGNSSMSSRLDQKKESLQKYYWEELASLGLEPKAVDMELHYALIRPEISRAVLRRYSFRELDVWAKELLDANNRKNVFIKEKFAELLAERYREAASCYARRLSTWFCYGRSSVNPDDRCCLKLSGLVFSKIFRKLLNFLRLR